MNSDYLNTLKSKGNWTYQQLSEVSGVPSSTISRLFKGQMVSMESVSAVIQAMGGSLDILMGIRQEDSDTTSREEKEMYTTALRHSRETLAEQRKWMRRFFIAFCVSVGLIIFILLAILIDLLHPYMGWIRT
nr:MAG TPA: Helix-turn-helix XRE-family like protein [Bacteriophage sp.]